MYVTLKTLLDPAKDELLVVEPAFPAYVKMATLENVAVRSVAMLEDDDFAIDADRILAAIGDKTRAIVICSPSNPTGRILSRDQAELLVRGLGKRGGAPIWLIHDEIYREQTFTTDAAYLAERLSVHDRHQLAQQEQRAYRPAPWVDPGAARVRRAGDQSPRLGDVVRR